MSADRYSYMYLGLLATHKTNHMAMHLYNQVAERSGFVGYRHDLL